MTSRELIVLGTASQVPTRTRAHHGAVLRWDDEVMVFDPGEGSQRQLMFAGLSASKITRIFITHFHGDHCLGLPGLLQRMSLDGAPGPVDVYFPAAGQEYFDRLRHAVAYHERTQLRPVPCEPGIVAETPAFRIVAAALRHRVPCLGWRLEEPEGVRMLPDRLAAEGVAGPDVGRLRASGEITVQGRRITLDEVSEPRRGQVFAFVMDTADCSSARELARDADLLVCESTYLSGQSALAEEYGHLTATQAARIARDAGARRLVLTHFSQRHADAQVYADEARKVFDDVVIAEDLAHIAVPPRGSH